MASPNRRRRSLLGEVLSHQRRPGQKARGPGLQLSAKAIAIKRSAIMFRFWRAPVGTNPSQPFRPFQELKSKPILKTVSDELDILIQKSLHDLKADDFVLSIYFGHNLAKRYDRLSAHLYNVFQAPLLRAYFHRDQTSETEPPHWHLISIKPISGMEIPPEHYDFVHASGKKLLRW